MRRLKTSVLVVLVFLCVLWGWRWWEERTPPGRVVLRATFDFGAEMSSPELQEKGRQKALMVETEGRGRWRIVARGKAFVSERLPSKDTNDLFDIDKDGYPELFCWDNPRKLSGEFLKDSEGHFLPLRVYVFKRRESVRR